jgi:hypothetical protein
VDGAKLTATQKRWLEILKRRGRVRYSASHAGGIPERTADVLVRLGLARTEWQPVFRRSEHPRGLFLLPTEGF